MMISTELPENPNPVVPEGGYPALAWAASWVVYAFARLGREALASEELALPDRMAFELRDARTLGPHFGPATLDSLVEDLACVLNFLSHKGPGGRFKVYVKFHHLWVEWMPE